MNLDVKPLSNIEIFSIGVGVVGSGLQYQVGQTLSFKNKKATITHIIRDESSFEFYGEIVYMIFASIDESEPQMIKSFINQPVYISVRV
jgi:hypothetical protein